MQNENTILSAPRPPRSSSPFKLFSSAPRQAEEEDPAKTQRTQKRWTADYLTELRKPSGARPMGARPPPARNSMTSLDLSARISATPSLIRPDQGNAAEERKRSISPFRLPRASSAFERHSNAGRPLAREPDIGIMEDIATANANFDNIKVDINGRKSPLPYYERGQRWMERQEAKSLRTAMEVMDIEEEKKVHSAAQEEAAELVWKHKFANKPYENPDVLRHVIKDHLRKGSHAKSQSVGPFESLYVTKGGVKDGKRTASDGSTSNKSDSSHDSKGSRVVSVSSKESSSSSGSVGKRYGSLSFRNPASRLFGSRRSSRKSRNSSGGKQSSLFTNPNDKIFEEPESTIETGHYHEDTKKVLKPKSRNISGSHQSPPQNEFMAKTSFVLENKFSSMDLHKTSPSQSRDPKYMSNELSKSPPPEEQDDKPAMKDGIEIRSDDIRAATSMRLRDRSEKLPQPTYVSDSPGRPIVSFDSGYKPKDLTNSQNAKASTITGSRPLPNRFSTPRSSLPSTPAPVINTPEPTSDIKSSGPPIPTITLPSDSPGPISKPQIPSINLPKEEPSPAPGVPAISLPDQPSSQPAPPRQQLRGHWSPAFPRAKGAHCHFCGHHIAGRTLSAAGARFHPECFNCYTCGTNLEHVAFYPEPENARNERLATDFGASTPGSHDTRFFCHLDFHENFSPRCKSCKTPIEGEVVLACGSQWHQGHFFCAQCGDPFDGEKPFIEKDGWAWCVGCFKGRYSGKCRGCKRPVIEDGVMALGAEWHVDCFRCKECSGPFEDGKFFTRGEGEGPVCVRCEERRLKA